MNLVSKNISYEKGRWIILFSISIIWIYKFFQLSWLSQIGASPYWSGSSDRIHHVLEGIGYFSLLRKHIFCLGFIDLGISTCIILLWSRMFQKTASYLLLILGILYFITYRSIIAHPEHQMIGFLILTFLFLFEDKKSFSYFWKLGRFYVAFIFISAALWKMSRGSAWDPDALQKIFLIQFPQYYLNHNEEIPFFALQIIKGKLSSTLIWNSVILLELSFLLSFIKPRWNQGLGICLLLFLVADACFMQIYFIEFAPLSLLFFYQPTDI